MHYPFGGNITPLSPIADHKLRTCVIMVDISIVYLCKSVNVWMKPANYKEVYRMTVSVKTSGMVPCSVIGCINEILDLPHNHCRFCGGAICPDHTNYFVVNINSRSSSTLKTVIVCPDCKPRRKYIYSCKEMQ